MKEKKIPQTFTSAEMRGLAEERLKTSGEMAPPAGTGEESLRLLHELQVHQIELEMQNHELRMARDEKEAALEKYTDLYDFAPVSYFSLDRTGTIRNVNLTGTGFIGIDRSLLIGKDMKLFIVGKARKAFSDFLDKVFSNTMKEVCELEFLTKGQPPRIAQVEALADASGQECRIALIDITERKLAEDNYRGLFENSNDALMTLEPPFWKFTSANQATLKMFEAINEEDFISLGPCGFSPDFQPDGRSSEEKAKEMIETAMREGAHSFKWTHRRIGGEEFPADVLLSRMERNGKVILQATVRDITQRVRAEELRQVRIILLEYAAGHTLKELLHKTLDEVGRLLDSPIGFYHFVESDQKTLSLQAWSTLTSERFCKAEGSGLHYSLDQAGVWVDCVRERRPVIHNDYASLPNRKGLPEGHAEVIRELVVPILRNDLIVAILGIGNKPCGYTPEDVEVVSLLADLTWEITERKRAEQLTTHFAAIVESSDDAIISKTLNGVITSWNDGAEKIYGYSADEVVGRPVAILVPPDRDDEIPRLLDRVGHGLPVSHYETMRIRKDGRRIYVSLSLSPIRNKSGAITEVSTIARDITEWKQADEELKKANAYNRSLIEASLDPLVTIGPEGRITDVNAATEEVTGYRRKELIGSDFSDYFNEPKAARTGYQQVFRDGLVRDYPLEIRHRDGRTTPVLYNASVYRDEGGNVLGVFAAARDITEHKKLEQQLRQAQKMEAIGTLAGGIAHDFNNILTAIVGYGYMAQMSMGPADPQQENIRHMLEGADRAARLTKDLLIFSRKEVSEKSPVDLNKIVGIVENFLVRIIGEDIVCKVVLHDEPIVIYADPHQLEQVLMNLATNARDAMQGGGNLTISSEPVTLGDDFVRIHGYGSPGRYALLTVSDTGSGMVEATRKKIFEPFFTTKDVGKGTGLGLAVVYGIIKQHDGYINVYSEPRIGTTFKIYLPLITSEARSEQITPVVEILAKGTETILLAEDNDSVRSLISIVLKREGYTVIEAVDGKDAVKKFMENRETIQLLVTDLIMPNLNGKEAYDEMKAWRPELKAIFASGYAPDAIREKMSLDSDIALMSKPITPYALLKTVRSILDEGKI